MRSMRPSICFRRDLPYGRGDVGHRPEESKDIVAQRKEATAAPEVGSALVDHPDHKGASSHEFGGGRTPKYMFQAAGSKVLVVAQKYSCLVLWKVGGYHHVRRFVIAHMG